MNNDLMFGGCLGAFMSFLFCAGIFWAMHDVNHGRLIRKISYLRGVISGLRKNKVKK